MPHHCTCLGSSMIQLVKYIKEIMRFMFFAGKSVGRLNFPLNEITHSYIVVLI